MTATPETDLPGDPATPEGLDHGTVAPPQQQQRVVQEPERVDIDFDAILGALSARYAADLAEQHRQLAMLTAECQALRTRLVQRTEERDAALRFAEQVGGQ
jgi:hypothetical protein